MHRYDQVLPEVPPEAASLGEVYMFPTGLGAVCSAVEVPPAEAGAGAAPTANVGVSSQATSSSLVVALCTTLCTSEAAPHTGCRVYAAVQFPTVRRREDLCNRCYRRPLKDACVCLPGPPVQAALATVRVRVEADAQEGITRCALTSAGRVSPRLPSDGGGLAIGSALHSCLTETDGEGEKVKEEGGTGGGAMREEYARAMVPAG